MRRARLYHYHNEHVRGTSINIGAIAHLSTRDPIGTYSRVCRTGSDAILFPKIVGFSSRKLQHQKWVYGFSHNFQEKVKLPAGTKSFTVFRDSVDRCLSLYSSVRAHKRIGRVDEYSDFVSAEEPTPREFLDFVERLPPEKSMFQLAMFSPRLETSEAISNIESVDFVCAGLAEAEFMFTRFFDGFTGFPIVQQAKEVLPFDYSEVREAASEILSEEIGMIESVIDLPRRDKLRYPPEPLVGSKIRIE